MERLEANLNYESCSAPPLLLAAIEDVRFNLSIHPGTLLINATLGNMRAQDGVLPEVYYHQTLLRHHSITHNIFHLSVQCDNLLMHASVDMITYSACSVSTYLASAHSGSLSV